MNARTGAKLATFILVAVFMLISTVLMGLAAGAEVRLSEITSQGGIYAYTSPVVFDTLTPGATGEMADSTRVTIINDTGAKYHFLTLVGNIAASTGTSIWIKLEYSYDRVTWYDADAHYGDTNLTSQTNSGLYIWYGSGVTGATEIMIHAVGLTYTGHGNTGLPFRYYRWYYHINGANVAGIIAAYASGY